MLTGDKRETAKNIAISCGLLRHGSRECTLNISGSTAEAIQKEIEAAINQAQTFARGAAPEILSDDAKETVLGAPKSKSDV